MIHSCIAGGQDPFDTSVELLDLARELHMKNIQERSRRRTREHENWISKSYESLLQAYHP